MVDITQLRIGNYIVKNHYSVTFSGPPISGALYRVTLEMFNDINNRPFDYIYAPIDEEFILRRGFEKCIFGYRKGDFILNSIFYVIVETNDYYVTATIAKTYYIHELQNAYLAFTGKELD